MTSAFLGKTLLAFALLHSVLQGQICLLLQVSLDFLLCILVPYNEKDILFGCQFQKVLQVFIEPFNFSFFSITGWGIDLDYCDIEWFSLETNRDHSVIFEIVSKYCILGSFVDYEGCSISPKGFLPSLLYQNLILMLVLSLQTMFFCLLLQVFLAFLLLHSSPL